MDEVKFKEMLKKANEILKVQGNDGNWNANEYMHGYYNGMELTLSIFENRDAKFKNAPEKYLADK